MGVCTYRMQIVAGCGLGAPMEAPQHRWYTKAEELLDKHIVYAARDTDGFGYFDNRGDYGLRSCATAADRTFTIPITTMLMVFHCVRRCTRAELVQQQASLMYVHAWRVSAAVLHALKD
jgi:hypothetical protein